MICLVLLAAALTWLVLLHLSLELRSGISGYPTTEFIRARRRRRRISDAKAEMFDLYADSLTDMSEAAQQARSQRMFDEGTHRLLDEGDPDELP